MRIRLIALLIAVFTLMYVGYSQTTAQNLVTCPSLVQQAISAMGSNCGSLDRNSACYGFDNVQASFTRPQANGFFTEPSDRAHLLDLETLHTSAMDQQTLKWGIALLSVQANLPNTLPGQNVMFMLIGDTQVENAVDPQAAFTGGATVDVTMQIGGNIYYEPDFSAQVVGTAPQGAVLTADAISQDGQWVRVTYQAIPGWVTAQVITPNGDLTTLPVVTSDTDTPMQAFYFRTSISGTDCTEAPNALVIQGPQDLTVDLNANGADMRIGSTIALYLLPVDSDTQQYLTDHYGDIGAIQQLMQIIVLDGHVVLNPGKPNETSLNTGETSFICLSDPHNLGIDGLTNDRNVLNNCPWAPPRPVTVEDIEKFRSLEGVTLNYPIDLPLELPTLTPSPTPSRTPTRLYIPFTATHTPTPTPTPVPQEGGGNQPPPPPPQPTATNTPATCDNIVFPANPSNVAELRADITAANDENCHPNGQVINLNGGTFDFADAPYDADGPNTLPPITSDITIDGGGGTLSSNMDTERRFFHVNGGKLSLAAVTVRGGSSGSSNGGAIFNAGTVTLTNVTLDSNFTDAGGGGAVYNSGTLTVTSSTLSNNHSAGSGGAIYNDEGSVTISDSTFAGNSADTGGAINSGGEVNITASTFNSNSGTTGGGLWNSGNVTILNSTISNNSSGIGGGAGIYSGGGSVTLNFATLYQNTVNNSGAAFQIAGGAGTVNNSIVAGSLPNCSGSFTVSGANFDDDGTCGVTHADALALQPLNSNGGPTQTNAISFGSQAIDSNDCSISTGGSLDRDQRGATFGRPSNGNGSPSATECDTGAYEYQS